MSFGASHHFTEWWDRFLICSWFLRLANYENYTSIVFWVLSDVSLIHINSEVLVSPDRVSFLSIEYISWKVKKIFTFFALWEFYWLFNFKTQSLKRISKNLSGVKILPSEWSVDLKSSTLKDFPSRSVLKEFPHQKCISILILVAMKTHESWWTGIYSPTWKPCSARHWW